MSTGRVVLRLTDVVRTFPGVIALRGVTFQVAAGEVHALVGENGAGKSTLMAVAAGALAPDRGTVEIAGRLLESASPTAAQALGLAVVYQHLSILEDLTVAENMVFAMPPGRRPTMARAAAWTREQLLVAGANIDPNARVTELSTADRQLLEIAKALALESKVLVLDEPTESLNAAESERLFAQIRSITSSGAAVVYISHRLPEVKQIADRLTVLRDGEVRGTFAAGDVSEGEILRLIIGREVEQVFPGKRAPEEEARAVLQVRGFDGARFHDVDLDVAVGEIVGLAGVEGNGQRPFLRALAGLVPALGKVELEGKPVQLGTPVRAVDAGIVHLPGDRHREGVLLSLGVRDNVSLLSLRRVTRSGIVQRRREAAVVSDQVERLAVRTPSLETPASSLSGGNQQKLLFARSQLAEPRVFLADEPTRGVDAGARIELYRVLRQMADEGKAVVLLSSDAVELQGLCDRVLVFSRGRVVRTLEGEEITEENITGTALTSTSAHTRPGERALGLLRVRRFVSGDYLPSLILALLILALGTYTSIDKSRFLTAFNFHDMLLVASALAFISLGQLIVLLTGGIDLSVGPLAGVVVVVLSFFVGNGMSSGRLVLGILAVIGTGLAVGLANGLLIRVFKLAPVLATLATFIVLQGVALLLRPEIGGFYRFGVVQALKTSVGWVPIAFVVAVVLTVVCELVLRFTRPGLQLRAVGSDETRAHRLGARVTATHLAGYVLCSLLTVAGGIMLGAHVGVGDPAAGVNSNFTLTSIAAVVLGGASIFGGRGSFVGAFLGACLIQEVTTSTTFLQLGVAWQYWLPGILILVAAGTYSRARGVRSAALGAEA